jgi:hypothetical protein
MQHLEEDRASPLRAPDEQRLKGGLLLWRKTIGRSLITHGELLKAGVMEAAAL